MKEKVFVIGFQKTGTTSLETALETLGYRVFGGDKNLMKYQNKEDLKEYILGVMQNWDAVQDMPWPLFYRELYDLYPNAKFILTYRRPDKWIESVVRYFGSIRNPINQKIYNAPYPEGNEEAYLAVYNNYNDEVKKFFREKRNFLLMEMETNFDFKTLCTFLEIEKVPMGEFPRSRKNKQSLSKFKAYRSIRSAYWNFLKKY